MLPNQAISIKKSVYSTPLMLRAGHMTAWSKTIKELEIFNQLCSFGNIHNISSWWSPLSHLRTISLIPWIITSQSISIPSVIALCSMYFRNNVVAVNISAFIPPSTSKDDDKGVLNSSALDWWLFVNTPCECHSRKNLNLHIMIPWCFKPWCMTQNLMMMNFPSHLMCNSYVSTHFTGNAFLALHPHINLWPPHAARHYIWHHSSMD